MKSPLIIERPDLQVWQQKAMFGALTAVFWAVWVFLWMPLITLLIWLFFGQRFQLHMFELNGYRAFMGLLAIYSLVIGTMGGGLLLWATYNHYRFRGIDRRRNMAVPSATAMGAYIKHPSTAIDAWRSYPIMTVDHDQHGGIVKVEPLVVLPAHTLPSPDQGVGKPPPQKPVEDPKRQLSVSPPAHTHSTV